MGILDVEQNRLRQQEIEVRALIALIKHARVFEVKQDAEVRLWQMAFPDKVAENLKRLEQKQLGLE